MTWPRRFAAFERQLQNAQRVGRVLAADGFVERDERALAVPKHTEDQRANAPLIYGADVDTANATAGVGERNFQRAGQMIGSATGVGTGRAGISQGDTAATNNALLMALGLSNNQAAIAALQGR